MHAHRHANRHQHNIHSHTWIVGAVGLVAGLVLMIYLPSLEAISRSLVLLAAFHIVGGIVLLASAYAVGLRGLIRRLVPARPAADRYDFGWGPEWMNGLGLAALVALAAAVAIEIAAPAWWPFAFVALLLGAAFFAGNAIMRSFRSRDHIVLPMVDLLRSDHDVVLDAGCGAGRTTIALARVLRQGSVIAVDRFDADYIDSGGRALIEHNLRVAGLTDRVRIEAADLTALPFADASIDSAVSTNVFDHLGRHKAQALHEVFRVLKPGGRFLMAVWVPGLPMFAVASLLSLFLTSRAAWLQLARNAGFAAIDRGVCNYAWFVLLEKPLSPSRGTPS